MCVVLSVGGGVYFGVVGYLTPIRDKTVCHHINYRHFPQMRGPCSLTQSYAYLHVNVFFLHGASLEAAVLV